VIVIAGIIKGAKRAMSKLAEEIKDLIALEQEGGYWDFKREWYTRKSNMLHDIICMANNLENRDAYIIIGVDQETGCFW